MFKGKGTLSPEKFVWEYGSKFLSMVKEGCEIVPVADIGETAPNDEVFEEDDYKPSTSYQALQYYITTQSGCVVVQNY